MAFEARTSSRSPVLRLLLVALGLLLNLWIYHRWGYVCVKRRGGRKPGERSFRAILMQIEHPGLGDAGLNHVAWGGCLSAFIQELPGLGFSMPALVALFEDLCQLFLSPLKDRVGGGGS